jgi:hypothetical protein
MEKSSARGNNGSSPSSGGYSIGGTPDKKRLRSIPAIQEQNFRELKIDYINENFKITIIILSEGKSNFLGCRETVSDKGLEL